MREIQETFDAVIHNYVLITSVSAWLTAQVIKALLVLIATRKFSLERLMGSGGMPSSHSATVCCLVVSLGKTAGVSSPVFALAFLFAVIVMHDAMGVRLESGKHAKMINILRKKSDIKDFSNEKDLKELLGHTALQVFAGALLGIAIGLAVPAF